MKWFKNLPGIMVVLSCLGLLFSLPGMTSMIMADTESFTLGTYIVGEGWVNREPDICLYPGGTPVALRAVPADGWSFAGWSGDLTGANNPAMLTMDAAKVVTATFIRDAAPQFTLTATTVGQGSLLKAPDRSSYDTGSSVTLTAAPATGWSFAGWGGALTGAVNPAALTMDADKAVTATFTPVPSEAPVPQNFNASVTGFAGGTLRLSPSGLSLTDARLMTGDNCATLIIPQGTRLLNGDGEALSQISVEVLPQVPAPPAKNVIVSPYRFGLDGATFAPPITLSLNYDESALPPGAEPRHLYIAFWDGSEWIALESTVDLSARTVSAKISHFSSYALIARLPAEFAISGFTVTPSQVDPDGLVKVQAVVSNNGGATGQYTAIIKINEVMVVYRELTLAAGGTEEVLFETRRNIPGEYTVDLNSQIKKFTVPEKSVATAPVPVPAPSLSTIAAAPVKAVVAAPKLVTAAPAPVSGEPDTVPPAAAAIPNTEAVIPDTSVLALWFSIVGIVLFAGILNLLLNQRR